MWRNAKDIEGWMWMCMERRRGGIILKRTWDKGYEWSSESWNRDSEVCGERGLGLYRVRINISPQSRDQCEIEKVCHCNFHRFSEVWNFHQTPDEDIRCRWPALFHLGCTERLELFISPYCWWALHDLWWKSQYHIYQIKYIKNIHLCTRICTKHLLFRTFPSFFRLVGRLDVKLFYLSLTVVFFQDTLLGIFCIKASLMFVYSKTDDVYHIW